jgi:hypothetical protein
VHRKVRLSPRDVVSDLTDDERQATILATTDAHSFGIGHWDWRPAVGILA